MRQEAQDEWINFPSEFKMKNYGHIKKTYLLWFDFQPLQLILCIKKLGSSLQEFLAQDVTLVFSLQADI